MSRTIALLPSLVPDIATISDNQLAEKLTAAAIRLAETAASLSDDELLDVRLRWDDLIQAVAKRRRKANGKAEAAARWVEMEIGKRMRATMNHHGLRGSSFDGLAQSEKSDFCRSWDWKDVTISCIESSTNDAPSTRWKVQQEIRRHRIAIGDVVVRKRDVRLGVVSLREVERRQQQAENLERSAREKMDRLNAIIAGREQGSDASFVYQHIRQALVVADRLTTLPSVKEELVAALTEAEAACVEALQLDRMQVAP